MAHRAYPTVSTIAKQNHYLAINLHDLQTLFRSKSEKSIATMKITRLKKHALHVGNVRSQAWAGQSDRSGTLVLI